MRSLALANNKKRTSPSEDVPQLSLQAEKKREAESPAGVTCTTTTSDVPTTPPDSKHTRNALYYMYKETITTSTTTMFIDTDKSAVDAFHTALRKRWSPPSSS